MSRYEIIICWSHDDNAYIAEAPELAGCMPMDRPGLKRQRMLNKTSKCGLRSLRNWDALFQKDDG